MASNDIALPSLPTLQRHRDTIVIPPDQLTRKKLQSLLHLITADLKKRGTKTPHIFLPFRSKVDDTKLELFLRRVFPNGVMVNTSNTMKVQALLQEFDEFTLICALKYLWCRLPSNEVIGWKVYLEFKRREREAGYPKDAFLTIMPKCLSSSSHASIVYDFLDLLISIASNSQYNHLSGRKISKMASMWAFNSFELSTSAFYDATIVKENSFLDGLEAWKSTCHGLFHLLLAFLRAMLPDTETEALNLPKTLQTLLITNTYPPPENSNSAKSVITIPCVQVRSTKRCSDPYELVSKARHTLRFDKRDSFLSIENYTILKNIFQRDSTSAIVSTLTEESRRVLSRLSADPIPSEYGLSPGWSRIRYDEDPNIPSYSEVVISNVTLQDYYIWTWLSSLASDQSVQSKSLFGRSIVVEAGLRGFQKWLIISETTILPEDYINTFRHLDNQQSRHIEDKQPHVPKDLPLPPVPRDTRPPPIAKDPFLPEMSFTNDQFSIEDPALENLHLAPSNYEDEVILADQFQKKAHITTRNHANRPRPPPLELEHSNTDRLEVAHPHEPKSRGHSPARKLPYQRSANHSPQHHPEYENYQAYATQMSNQEFHEPYETYKTPFDRDPEPASREPFDNYEVSGEQKAQQYAEAHYQQRPVKQRPVKQIRAPEKYSNQVAGITLRQDDYLRNPQHSGMYSEEQNRSQVNEFTSSKEEVQPLSHHHHHHHHHHQNSSHSPSGVNNPTASGEVGRNESSIHEHPNGRPYNGMIAGPALKHAPGDRDPSQYAHGDHPPETHLKDMLYPPQDQYPSSSQYPTEQYNGSDLPPPPVAKEKKKKKKKKKTKNVDEFDIANLPDGPPPSLPPSGEINGSPGYYEEINDNNYDFQHNLPPSNDPSYAGQTKPTRFASQEALVPAKPPKDSGRSLSASPRHHKKKLAQNNLQPPQDQFLQPTLIQYERPISYDPYAKFGVAVQPEQYKQGPDLAPPKTDRAPSLSPTYTQPQFAPHGNLPPHPQGRVHSQSPTQTQGQAHAQPQVAPQAQHPQNHHQPPAQHQVQQATHLLPHGQPHPAYTQTAQQPPLQPVHTQADIAPHGQTYLAPPPAQQPMLLPQSMGSGQMRMPPPPQAAAGVPPAPVPGQPMPYYYPPPQGYYMPPQGYAYPPQPMYYPPPQGYYPPPPPQQQPKPKEKPTTSELTMMGMPNANSFKKNTKPNKASMRAALNLGFGI